MHLAAFFFHASDLSTFLYDHSQLHGVTPYRGIWQHTRGRATLLTTDGALESSVGAVAGSSISTAALGIETTGA